MKKKFFATNKFGFRKEMDNNQAFMTLTKCVCMNINKGNQVLVVFSDLSKSIDTVNHELFLKGFNDAGFTLKTFEWLISHMNECAQYTRLRADTSRTNNILAGVPQCSVLAALFFLIHHNRLCGLDVDGEIIACADDTAVVFAMEIDELIKRLKSNWVKCVHGWKHMA